MNIDDDKLGLHVNVDEMIDLWLGAEDLQAFLHDMAYQATKHLTGADLSCGITVRLNDGPPTTFASTDEFAERMDHIQFEVDAGPCLHALRADILVEITHMGTDRRWPTFRARARDCGAGACMTVPLSAVGHDRVGALNVYARHPYAFTEENKTQARRFADQAAGAIALASQLDRPTRRAEQLRTALASRSTVDRAVGIIMGQEHRTAESVLATLRSASNDRNVELVDLAADLVSRTGDQKQPGPAFR